MCQFHSSIIMDLRICSVETGTQVCSLEGHGLMQGQIQKGSKCGSTGVSTSRGFCRAAPWKGSCEEETLRVALRAEPEQLGRVEQPEQRREGGSSRPAGPWAARRARESECWATGWSWDFFTVGCDAL